MRKKKHGEVTPQLLLTEPPSTNMPSRSSDCITIAEGTSGEDEVLDDNSEGPEAEDNQLEQEPPRVKPIRIPPRVQNPPSPSFSISTTTSELEIEQGEALLKVKRLRAKEEPEDPTLPTEGESDKPAPKKRKTSSTGTKRKGKNKKKSGARAYSIEVPTDRIAFDRKNSYHFGSREAQV